MDGAWYVFSPRSRYKERGVRPARGIKTTAVGYWKSNSAEADVVDDDGEVIGRVNSLTLALGHQPRGKATHWRMKEYRIPQFQIPLGQEDSNRLVNQCTSFNFCVQFKFNALATASSNSILTSS